MAESKLKVATCQFAVGESIKKNAAKIDEYLNRAKEQGAQIVHFSECALSGYAGDNFETFDEFDWEILREQSQKITDVAERLGLWVVLGSTHRLTEPNKPHNSLYLISPKGKVANRYDKRFCTPRDLEYYTPGNRFVNFDINGIKCSLLICFDLRFPEIYRELKKQNVDCVFQSFYNARADGRTIHTQIMRQTMQCRAATNYFWMSMTNSSGYYSPYPSCFIQPDGKIAGQLTFNKAGMMVNTVDLSEQFYDAAGPFREMVMKGALSNGPGQISDARSVDTTVF